MGWLAHAFLVYLIVRDTSLLWFIYGECEAGNKITLSFDTKKDPDIEVPVKVRVKEV